MTAVDGESECKCKFSSALKFSNCLKLFLQLSMRPDALDALAGCSGCSGWMLWLDKVQLICNDELA